MKKIALFAAAITASAPAFAQDADTSFTGPWVAGIVGYENDSIDIEDFDEGDADNSVDDVMYGAAIGYDYDLGTAVIGIEAEYSDSEVGLGENDYLSIEAGRDIYVGGRVGAKLSPNAMVYGKLGYTNVQIKTDVSAEAYEDLTGEDLGAAAIRYEEEFDGFRAGAGAEYSSGQMFGRLEYRYSSYDLNIEALYDGDTGVDMERHQVVLMGGFRF